MNGQVSITARLKSLAYVSRIDYLGLDQVPEIVRILIQNNLEAILLDANAKNFREVLASLQPSIIDIFVGVENISHSEEVSELLDYGVEYVICDFHETKILTECQGRNLSVFPRVKNLEEFKQAANLNPLAIVFQDSEFIEHFSEIDELSCRFSIPIILLGAISSEDIAALFRSPQVIAFIGEHVASRTLIQNKDYETIEFNAQALVREILDLSLAHIGINAKGRDDANQLSVDLDTLLQKGTRETAISHFVGSEFEIMHSGLGTHGHVGLYTNSIEFAMRVLESRGYKFLPEYTKKDNQGRIFLSYFTKEFGGFAFHLLQRN